MTNKYNKANKSNKTTSCLKWLDRVVDNTDNELHSNNQTYSVSYDANGNKQIHYINDINGNKNIFDINGNKNINDINDYDDRDVYINNVKVSSSSKKKRITKILYTDQENQKQNEKQKKKISTLQRYVLGFLYW